MSTTERMHTIRLSTRQLSVTASALATLMEVSREGGRMATDCRKALNAIDAQTGISADELVSTIHDELNRPWWRRRKKA